MAYTDVFDIDLGTSGLTLKAALVTGSTIHATIRDITTGLVELGQGHYQWLYTNFPEGYQGSVVFYTGTLAAAANFSGVTVQATAPVGPVPSNLKQIDGLATNGNNATLNLKQLNVVNSAGSALVCTSTGSSGHGAIFTGNSLGAGLKCIGAQGIYGFSSVAQGMLLSGATAGLTTVGGVFLSSGGLTVTGAVALQSTLTVSGATAFTGNLTVGGTTTFSGAFEISSDITLGGNITANANVLYNGTTTYVGAVTHSSTTVYTGNVSYGGAFSVAGATTLTGAVSLGSTLAVTGATTLASMGITGNLVVGGTSTLNLAADSITAATIAADSITAAKVAADVSTEISTKVMSDLSAAHGSGAYDTAGAAPTGAFLINVTVNDGTTALQNARVRVTDGSNNTWIGVTNVSGIAAFSLDAATYEVSITKGGYNFTPVTGKTVTGNHTGTLESTYSMTAATISAPTDPSICLLYGDFIKPNGEPAAGAKVTLTLIQTNPVTAQKIIVGRGIEAVTDETGHLEIDLVRTDAMDATSTYTLKCAAAALHIENISLTSSTKDIQDLIP